MARDKIIINFRFHFLSDPNMYPDPHARDPIDLSIFGNYGTTQQEERYRWHQTPAPWR